MLHYEDLVARPREELRRITDFCNLDALAAVRVKIELQRNSLRRPLLSDADVRSIRDRVKHAAEQFGYAGLPR